MVIGLAGLAYPFIVAQPTQAQLLIGLGGVLLASQSLNSLADDMLTLITGMLAWQQVEALVKVAGVNGEAVAPPVQKSTTPDGEAPVLMARNLVFRYRERARPILRECSMKIQEGDRLLLEGPSGGGKSTLAALLAGLRRPESGLLLLKSLDLRTLGSDEWRRKVVVVPQFHENHVFTETFAFNLLMGRRWPPLPEDLDRAEAICRELGLGNLIDRMPAGLDQPVGASGWQLSHGEASRLFIARALLQDADLVILDETFGTLDPENLQRAMQCVLNRAPTLMVIAHP
jgi:ATP-binding cassette subfamily B protein